MNSAKTLLALLISANADFAAAYELATHARITYRAYLGSVLSNDPSVYQNLGIVKAGSEKWEGGYFDVRQTEVRIRTRKDFDWDQDKIPQIDGQFPGDLANRVPGWIMRGAVREDDSGRITAESNTAIFKAEPEPLDDPWGDFNRWCNHFFDPYRNRALELPLLLKPFCLGDTYASAPIWATGVPGPFSTPLSSDEAPNRRNHFTVLDAREAMWRALTGYDKSRTRRVAADRATRDAYWATMFRSLGNVLHLNQDMAQPQHTRNEAHGSGPSAWYEKYIDGRAKGATQIKYRYFGGVATADNAPPLGFGTPGYIPQFTDYGSYWSTGTGSATLSGKGLADYSSRGFFTPAKNLGNAEFPSPPSDAGAFSADLIVAANGWRSEYLRGTVRDAYAGEESRPIRMTRRSIWGEALKASGTANPSDFYTLDLGTYDDRAELLIPRAVAYSAGILNHFFRGRLEINLPTTGFYAIRDLSLDARPVPPEERSPWGFSKLKLRLKNITEPIKPPNVAPVAQQMSDGKLVAVVGFRRNSCGQGPRWPDNAVAAKACLSSTEEIAVSEAIEITASAPIPQASAEQPGGIEYVFNFLADPIPPDAWNLRLQVVYRGRLGDESDAVVVATKDISEPTHMSLMNTTDHVVVNGRFYSPAMLAADPALFRFVFPECVKNEAGKLSLYSDCYNRPDRFTVTAGTSPVTISAVGDDAVMPRHYIAVAFLGDPATPVTLNYRPGDIRCALQENPLVVPAYRAQLDANDNWTYAAPLSLRGVKVWRSYLCYEDLGITPTASVEQILGQLDYLADEEEYPTPVTIFGW